MNGNASNTCVHIFQQQGAEQRVEGCVKIYERERQKNSTCPFSQHSAFSQQQYDIVYGRVHSLQVLSKLLNVADFHTRSHATTYMDLWIERRLGAKN